ncbi:MAG: PspC domain-containing protein [Candidatus Zixiibacteriota bacterium]|nr:MAG: PspC domain-containing protein [candidate division Zixibacteria bacterium]
MEKRLYRSQTNKVIAGVCGGLGEYFEIDPVFVRIVLVLLVLAPSHGIGILAYIVAWILMPKRDVAVEQATAEPPREGHYSSWNRYLPGLILMVIGIILLIRENWYWFRWELFWPLVIIAVGLILIFRRPTIRQHADQAEPNMTVNGQEPKPENGGSLS